MFTSVYDDGSSVTVDVFGNLVSIIGSDGVAQPVPPQGGSPIVQQFAALFNEGIRAVLSPTPNPAAQSQPVQTQATVASAINAYLPWVLIAAAVFAGYRFLVK